MPPTLLLAKPVLSVMPAAVDGRDTAQIRGDWSDVFSGAGTIDIAPGAERNKQRSYEFFCKDRAAIWALQQFFDGVKGRYGTFWIPTWRWDFGLCGLSMPAGIDYFYLTHSRIADLYATNPKRFCWLYVQYGDRWRLSRIASTLDEEDVQIPTIEENYVAGVDKVTLNPVDWSSPTPPEFGLGPVNGSYTVQWLRYVRLVSDALEWEEEGENMMKTTITVVEVPKEIPS
jgi:hypothetical protein